MIHHRIIESIYREVTFDMLSEIYVVVKGKSIYLQLPISEETYQMLCASHNDEQMQELGVDIKALLQNRIRDFLDSIQV